MKVAQRAGTPWPLERHRADASSASLPTDAGGAPAPDRSSNAATSTPDQPRLGGAQQDAGVGGHDAGDRHTAADQRHAGGDVGKRLGRQPREPAEDPVGRQVPQVARLDQLATRLPRRSTTTAAR